MTLSKAAQEPQTIRDGIQVSPRCAAVLRVLAGRGRALRCTPAYHLLLFPVCRMSSTTCRSAVESPRGAGGPRSEGPSAGDYFSFAYSALASFRMGMSGSASFQIVRKSWYAARAFAVSPCMA